MYKNKAINHYYFGEGIESGQIFEFREELAEMVQDYFELGPEICDDGVEDEGYFDVEDYWRSGKSYLDLLRFRKAEVLIDGKLK